MEHVKDGGMREQLMSLAFLDGRLGPKMFVEVIESALPGQLGGRFVITRSGVVVETVLGPGIDIAFVSFTGRLQSRFVCRPTGVDALVHFGVVNQQRGIDLGNIRSRRLAAVVRYRSSKIRHSNCESVRHAATKTETNGSDSSGTGGMALQEICRSYEVFRSLGGVQFSECF